MGQSCAARYRTRIPRTMPLHRLFEAYFAGTILWDASMPDDMPRKCLDVLEITALGFRPEISLETGIAQVIEDYRLLKTSA